MEEESWRLKKENMQYYNKTSKTYDLLHREEQTRKYKAVLRAFYTLKDHWILDVGSGTGLLVEVADPGSYIIGVDCSKSMLRQAKRKYGNRQDFLCVDADHLPFDERTFDTIFSFTLLQNMPDPEKTIVEMRRVAKEGSEIVLSATKKAFTEASFLCLLNEKKLVMSKFIDDEELKDYVLVCKCL